MEYLPFSVSATLYFVKSSLVRDLHRGKKPPVVLALSRSRITPSNTLRLSFGIRFFPTRQYLDFPKQKHVSHSNLKKRNRKSRVQCSLLALGVLVCFGALGRGMLAVAEHVGNNAEQASISFREGADLLLSQEYTESALAFAEARETLSALRSPLFLGNTNSSLFPSGTFSELFALAEKAATLGEDFANMAPNFRKIPTLLLGKKGDEVLLQLQKADQMMTQSESLFAQGSQVLQEAQKNPLLLPWKNELSTLAVRLPEARQSLLDFSILLVATREILGENMPHTTAIFFQNSGEIRATGGFPGSFALLTGNGGALSGVFSDIYAFSWKLIEVLPPPPGFERLTNRLQLQDANYFFHFPFSANLLRELLEKSGGPTAETIVVVTDDFFREVLSATGDVALPETGEKLTAENASLLLSFFVEAKAFGKHTPKDGMAKLFPELLERISALPPEKLLALFQTAIHRKWILVHSTNSKVEEAAKKLGISGEIPQNNEGDFLAIVSANVGGNKSDHFLQESISLTSVISLSGSVQNELLIHRKHSWGEKENAFVNDLFEKYGSFLVEPELLRNILGAGDNSSYTQVFVPLGAKLIGSTGIPPEQIEEDTQAGKTVFAFRFPKVSAGSEQEVILQYLLPNKLSFPSEFSLQFQFQPGRDSILFSRNVLTESGILSTKSLPEKMLLTGDARFSVSLSQ